MRPATLCYVETDRSCHSQIAVISPSLIQLRPPPHIRLASSRPIDAPLERPPSPSELLSSVSLSSSPSSNLRSRKARNGRPVFGQVPIAAHPQSASGYTEAETAPLVPDSMDWEPLETPTKPANPWSIVGNRPQVQLAQQRFRNEPVRTGLEDEMEARMVLDDRMDVAEDGAGASERRSASWWAGWLG